MNVKILFLDIDGVLNNSETTSRLNSVTGLDPKNIAVLNKLVELAEVKVVLSSSWRYVRPVPTMRTLFELFEVRCDLIDSTPLNGECRGHEIQEWLDAHPEVTSFVILDDSDDMDKLLPWLVRTNYHRGGLLDSHVEEALRILSDQPTLK